MFDGVITVFPLLGLKKGPLILVSILALLSCCAGVAFVSHAYISRDRRETRPSPGALPKPSVAVQSGPGAPGPVEVVRFTLYDVGIYPHEAHVGKGLVAITIEDLSGGSSGLVVERQQPGQARVTLGSVQRGQHWRARNDLRLDPGKYEVYMADRPDNRAVLIVEP